MLRLALFLLAAVFVSAVPSLKKQGFGVTSDPDNANGQTFDYIIVGAGLTGITVAARLSENPSTSVLVIEAGNDERTNPAITDISNFGLTIGTDMESCWETDMGRCIRGGRTLGGGSSVNAGLWTRGMKQQYDTLSQLLSEEDSAMNWTFDSLFSYMKKAETFNPPDDEQRAKGADYVPDFHGFSGPVQAAFTPGMFGGPHQPAYVDAVRNVTGINLCPDIDGGNANCVAYTPHTMNAHANFTRSSAATAYLSPVEQERVNWLTLVNHTVTQVLLDGDVPNITATGVKFKKSDDTGDTFTANARIDVILAAGSISTAQVLQVSGIGDPSVIEPLGIPTRVNLTTVGRNFQERAMNAITYSLQPSFDPDGRGPSNCMSLPSLRELFAEGSGSNGSVTADEVSAHIMAMYPTWAQSQAVNGLNAEALTTIFGIQAGLIVNDNAPVAELFFNTSYPEQLGILMWFQFPFSRGNVTITSPSVFAPPKVIVNWFDVDFDLAVQTAGVRASRKILQHPSFSEIFTRELSPSTDVVPDTEQSGADEAWQAWLMGDFGPCSHFIGTAAMMRRELGGVVDGKLRVYDTTNLRIIDTSILPFEFNTHPQSTMYGVAEKAADIIRSGI